MHHVAAIAIQNSTKVVKGAADIQIRDVNMPMRVAQLITLLALLAGSMRMEEHQPEDLTGNLSEVAPMARADRSATLSWALRLQATVRLSQTLAAAALWSPVARGTRQPLEPRQSDQPSATSAMSRCHMTTCDLCQKQQPLPFGTWHHIVTGTKDKVLPITY